MNDNDYSLSSIEMPKITYIIHLSDHYAVHCEGRVPNVFHRWMHKMIFGWRIEVKDD